MARNPLTDRLSAIRESAESLGLADLRAHSITRWAKSRKMPTGRVRLAWAMLFRETPVPMPSLYSLSEWALSELSISRMLSLPVNWAQSNTRKWFQQV